MIVLAESELVKKAKVDRDDGMLVKLPDPGGSPLIVQTQIATELRSVVWIVLVWIELVKKAKVDNDEGMLVIVGPRAVEKLEIDSLMEEYRDNVET